MACSCSEKENEFLGDGKTPINAYKTLTELYAAFRSLKSAFPSLVSEENLGKSVRGNDILAFKISSNPSTAGKVLWTSTSHGVELFNAEVMYRYAEWLLQSSDPVAKRILARNLTVIVPVLNVDNYSVTRKNVNGVDLNGNFAYGWRPSTDPTKYDYSGPAPESEPETKALARFLERLKPKWHVDLHQGECYHIWMWTNGQENAWLSQFRQLWTARGAQTVANTINANKYQWVSKDANGNVTGPIFADGKPYYRTDGMGGAWGQLCDYGKYVGANAFLLEFHPEEVTLKPRNLHIALSQATAQNPLFNDIEADWMPQFLPYAMSVSEMCGTDSPPSGGALPLLIIAGSLVALLVLSASKK